MEELRIKKPKSKEGYYWQTTDDGVCTGPFETDQMARDDFWVSDGEDMYDELVAYEGAEFAGDPREWLEAYEWVSHMHRPAISTDIFNANCTLEEFEEHNEEAVWYEYPPDWDQKVMRELELMLADALFRWAEKNDAWKQFRGLAT